VLSRNTGSVQRGRLRRLEVEATYAAAISRVARIGNFNALHKAVRFTSRGRVFPVSQRYMLATLTPAFSATSATLSPRLRRASRRWVDRLGFLATGAPFIFTRL
jgi:hypothetical protein